MFVVDDDQLPWKSHTNSELLSKYDLKLMHYLKASKNNVETIKQDIADIKSEILNRMKVDLEMLPIPFSVSSCLYNGISDKIQFIKSELNNPLSAVLSPGRLYLKRYYNEVVEAVEFYNKHCVVSGSYLKDALDEIKPYFE